MVQKLSKAAAWQFWKFYFLLVLFLSAASRALAFDVFPEYSGPTRYDVERWLLPSQYKHDLLSNPFTFLWPDDNDASYIASMIGANGAYAKKYGPAQMWFPTQERGYMRDYITTGLTFTYAPFMQQDTENDQQRNIFELKARYNNAVSFAVYADPTFYNGGTQIGAALILRTSENHEIRFFSAQHGFTGDVNPLQTGIFADPAQSFGFSGGNPYRNEPYMWMTNSYYDYFFRADLPHNYFDQQSLTGQKNFNYANYTGGFSTTETYKQTRFSQRLQASQMHQEQGMTDALGQELDTRKIQGLLNISMPLPMQIGGLKLWEIEGGLGFYQRDWQDEQSQTAHNFNLFPTLWLKMWMDKAINSYKLFKIGYITTHSFTWGNQNMLAGMSPYEVVREYTLVYEQKFNEHYKIDWTFDKRPGTLNFTAMALQVQRSFF